MEFKSEKDIEKEIIYQSSSPEEKAILELESIIETLPDSIRSLINEAFIKNQIPKEYLLSSIIFAYSNATGLAIGLDSMGFDNYGNLYLALIGGRGDMKSPAMKLAMKPLKTFDNEKYHEYESERKETSEPEGIKRKQLLIQNATIEAAHLTHYHNPYSLGIYMDELFQLINKMGNPNSSDGPAWRELLLEGNTNEVVDIKRKTMESYRIEQAYPVLLGSIQKEFIPKLFGGGNLESGLVDRFLFSYKLTHNPKLSKNGINSNTYRKYKDNLLRVLELRDGIEDGNESRLMLKCSMEAEDVLYNYKQSLSNEQQTASQLMQPYISKMQINIHKLIIIVHTIFESQSPHYAMTISTKTVDIAIKLLNFYKMNFDLICQEYSNDSSKKLDLDSVIQLGFNNGASLEEIGKVIGKNKSTVSRRLAKQK
ncbi:DUF3987 domain-containing protein [Salegentibacter chungangensis]|uniref:DUF3987 domain-containing protein n=1 Tax=Salegentibacter chungangensis TaxID=1335724 RepID=A0ABW3NQV6_9FLAO